MNDETAGVATEELVELKLKMYSFLVDDNSEHKRAKCVNKNFVVQRCFVESKMFETFENQQSLFHALMIKHIS